MHITFNVLMQLVIGIPLEMVHKWWRVLLVYFAGVLAGSLWTSITDPTVFLCGASGGVYALILAHLASIIMNWSEMEFAWLRLGSFLILMVGDIGTAVYDRYFGGIPTHKVLKIIIIIRRNEMSTFVSFLFRLDMSPILLEVLQVCLLESMY